MDKIREHAATHFCLVSLNRWEADKDDELNIEKPNGIVIETTIEQYLIETLMPFASAHSQVRENDWKKEWEELGEDSGYTEYVPTPTEKFNWQDVETMAHNLNVGSLILLEFLTATLPVLGLHDFEIEWEDETDEHCRTFLLFSPE